MWRNVTREAVIEPVYTDASARRDWGWHPQTYCRIRHIFAVVLLHALFLYPYVGKVVDTTEHVEYESL